MSQRIGRFEILRRLEARAGAASYLGRDTRDDASVIVDTWAGETPEAQALFLQRAAAAERLEHDSIARILDFGIDGATTCRIEQSPGSETLVARLGRRDELALGTALGWLARVARALEFAHSRGAVHGDLHPGAIAIRPDDTVAVRGFANPRPDAHVRYRAPELLRGETVDARTDIYAFGVLAHRALTFRPGEREPRTRRLRPKDRRFLWKTIRRQLEPHVAKSLVSVLEACLKEDPARRAESFTPVMGALEGAHQELAAAAAHDGATASADAAVPAAHDAAIAVADAAIPTANDAAIAVADAAIPTANDAAPAAEPADWTEAAVLNEPRASDSSLIDVELDGGAPAPEAGDPPSLDTVADAIRRPPRSRLRRRWLTFATVAGTALWLGGTLWWSKGSAVAGSEAPAARSEAPAEPRPPASEGPAEEPAGRPESLDPLEGAMHQPAQTPPPASLGIGRLALAPAWDPDITVSIDGAPPVGLDRRRVFEVEAEVDHVLTFELATRDYQIREQVVAQVGAGRLLETPVPLVRPGAVSIAPASDSERPVFVRIGDEAIGWTPILRLPVPAGDHVLSLLRNPTWRPDERVDHRIRVSSRVETTVLFDLETEPPTLIVDGRAVGDAPATPEATGQATDAGGAGASAAAPTD